MKILITGSDGFIGRNLCAHLKNRGYTELFEYDRGSAAGALGDWAARCEFVFHLAGVNRPESPEGYEENRSFTETLIRALRESRNKAPVLMSSSVHAAADTPYGCSKKQAEELLLRHSAETGAPVFLFRLPGVFGKWCRPHYNSVVATFCDSIAKGLPVRVDDPQKELALIHVDDVADAFIETLEGRGRLSGGYCALEQVRSVKLGALKALIESFRDGRGALAVPDMRDDLTFRLYSTYVSYLPEDAFSYPLLRHSDARGSFLELLRSEGGGQISLNVTKPGVTKGNHWHHTKTEKFCVVSGSALVRLQKLGEAKVTEYRLSGDSPEMLDIPPGYIHCVTNTGAQDMIMLIWANECFDPAQPDTFARGINE